ncbi:glycosyltransferase family 4 protein [Singulisphaera sp. Ch08]|uniref:Glycosyltransferase family 4 protein n=1 Tax=Singulisphaera sp. Ch08 TaxID=3120278 RepID=A0AAU7CKZ1_9BACT
MNVCVSVYSRFHAFDLAGQLHRLGHLGRLITSYPKFKAVEFGVPREKVRSLLLHEVAKRAWWKMPAALKPDWNLDPWFSERFERAAWKHIPKETDIFVGVSSFSERGLIEAKRLGAVTVLERGSTHIEFQRDILAEEFDHWGVKGFRVDPRSVVKELREYEITDYISVPTEFVKSTFLEKGIDGAKVIVNPYGVNLGQFHQLPKQDDVFRIIYVGGMSLQKGVHYLLKAFSELRLPDAELWLVGAKYPEIDPFFSKYEGTFRYFGAVPQATLHEYYSQCSAFVISSIQEGMAQVQLQAMACGLPLVCTTNTGGGELINEGEEGFVLPIRDTDALKERILALYKNPEACAAMGQAAKRRVSQGYTWDDYGQRSAATYQRILAARQVGEGLSTSRSA